MMKSCQPGDGIAAAFSMPPYERFEAWQLCHELVVAIYKATSNWPSSERFGLTAQIRRAAFSAAANIAEGSAKRGTPEFRRYLDITIGSLSEVSYALRVAGEIGVGEAKEVESLDSLRDRAGKATWGLYRSLGPR